MDAIPPPAEISPVETLEAAEHRDSISSLSCPEIAAQIASDLRKARETIERLEFDLADTQAQLAIEKARADAAEALAIPELDRQQARIVELERLVNDWMGKARSLSPTVTNIGAVFRRTPSPTVAKPVTSNLIILPGQERAA